MHCFYCGCIYLEPKNNDWYRVYVASKPCHYKHHIWVCKITSCSVMMELEEKISKNSYFKGWIKTKYRTFWIPKGSWVKGNNMRFIDVEPQWPAEGRGMSTFASGLRGDRKFNKDNKYGWRNDVTLANLLQCLILMSSVAFLFLLSFQLHWLFYPIHRFLWN